MNNNELQHYGVKGMHWGVRRYQNYDGTVTAAGKKHLAKGMDRSARIAAQANLKRMRRSKEDRANILSTDSKVEKAYTVAESVRRNLIGGAIIGGAPGAVIGGSIGLLKVRDLYKTMSPELRAESMRLISKSEGRKLNDRFAYGTDYATAQKIVDSMIYDAKELKKKA